MSRATFAARFLPRLVLAMLVLGALLVQASAAHAAATPEEACQYGRYRAAAKYSACEQKKMGKVLAGGDLVKFQMVISTCRVQYTSTWAKLQAKANGSGSTCDNDRFDTASVPGTVIDRLTGLQWEKKDNMDGTPNPGDPHDADNTYRWSVSGTAADGTAFTDLLATLNGGGCFAGQCDWRLPTIYELQTILLEPYPCTTSPCIDQAVFGPTVAFLYWSATTHATFTFPHYAWNVYFANGYVYFNGKDTDLYVRAVRAGL
jgi:hypothetical protein